MGLLRPWPPLRTAPGPPHGQQVLPPGERHVTSAVMANRKIGRHPAGAVARKIKQLASDAKQLPVAKALERAAKLETDVTAELEADTSARTDFLAAGEKERTAYGQKL